MNVKHMFKDWLLVKASKITCIYRLKPEARGATELYLMPNTLLMGVREQ